MKTETREIAEKIIRESVCNHGPGSECSEYHEEDITSRIEAALNARDERAAKILEDRVLALKSIGHPTTHNTWLQLDLADLAARIRGKD